MPTVGDGSLKYVDRADVLARRVDDRAIDSARSLSQQPNAGKVVDTLVPRPVIFFDIERVEASPLTRSCIEITASAGTPAWIDKIGIAAGLTDQPAPPKCCAVHLAHVADTYAAYEARSRFTHPWIIRHRGAHCEEVARERHRVTEVVQRMDVKGARVGVCPAQNRFECPCASAAVIDRDGPCFGKQLHAITGRRRSIRKTDGDEVALHGHGVAELPARRIDICFFEEVICGGRFIIIDVPWVEPVDDPPLAG